MTTAEGMSKLYREYVNRKGMLTIMDTPEQTKLIRDEEGVVRKKIHYHATPGIRIPVNIVDVRSVYGAIDILIRPHMGDGSTWVRLSGDRLAMLPEGEDFEDAPQQQEDGNVDALRADEAGQV